MKIGYVVLHYEFADITNECLESLSIHAPIAEVVVVDNGSSIPLTGNNRIVRLDSNMCLAAAMNVGTNVMLTSTDVDAVAQLNNDIVLTERTHAELTLALSSRPDAGVFAPVMDQPDAGYMYQPCPYPPGEESARYLRSTLVPRQVELVPFVDNAAWMIRRQTWGDTGELEERFSGASWGANYDYCWRARQRGWETALVRSAFVFHRHRASWNRLDPAYAVTHGARMMQEMRTVWGDLAELVSHRDVVRSWRPELGVGENR